MNNYELYHHGIKGQKWGVRRTAAELGHLAARKIVKATTKTGKAAGKQVNRTKAAIVKKAKQDVREQKEKAYYKKLHKKRISDMTDKELDDLSKRLIKEANLKDARYEERMVNARKFYEQMAKKPIDTFTTTLATQTAQKIVNGSKK